MVINQSQRPQFYQNQYLGAEDLAALVEYNRIQNARHDLGAHTWGIAIGLELKEKPSTTSGDQVDMYISPGYAWDGFGRPIVVLSPYKIPPERFKSIPYNAGIDGGSQAGHLVEIWLRYNEIETKGPRPGFEVCNPADQFARVQESFQIEVGDQLNQRDPIVIAGRAVDASLALQIFDPSDLPIKDASIPHQTFPDDNPNALWLIPLGFVRWKPNPNPSQPGNFVQRNPDDITQSRSVRQYIGVVAERIQAADGIIRMRDRTKDDPKARGLDDLVWVEGDLRVYRDTKLFGGKLDFRDEQGQNNDTPLLIQYKSFRAPALPGGGGPLTITELQVTIGQSKDGNNRFAVGWLQKDTSSEEGVLQEQFIVRADGKVGVGTPTPRNPLGIRAAEKSQELISFEDPSGTTRWHINQKLDENNPGLNFVETGIADGRLFLQAGGKVGIGTLIPRNTLGIRATGLSEELISFEDPSGTTKWHINQNLSGNNPGLNLVETGIADGRLFLQAGGKVGIGTTGPAETLDVRGNIKLHIDGSLFAPGGMENLRIIRGTVNPDGSTAVGAGFTVSREDTGRYSITFPPFPSPPSGSATQISFGSGNGGVTTDNAVFIEIDIDKVRVKTGASDGKASDRAFTFVILGPR